MAEKNKSETVRQQSPIIKSKFGKSLGYRTPDHFKAKVASNYAGKNVVVSNTFRTQHKSNG